MENVKDTTKNKHGLRNLATISYEVCVCVSVLCISIGLKQNRIKIATNPWNIFLQTTRFLKDGPCASQTKEAIVGFLAAMQPFNLNKSECLMMVNDPPTTSLHIQLMVEDSEERLTEEQVTEIIDIVQQWLIPQQQLASDEE